MTDERLQGQANTQDGRIPQPGRVGMAQMLRRHPFVTFVVLVDGLPLRPELAQDLLNDEPGIRSDAEQQG
jgi:hypothetical protein